MMAIDLNKMRRHEKEKDETWIEPFVEQGNHGVLGVCAGNQPYLNANNYVYLPEDCAIYFHRSKEGTLPQIIAENNQATYLIAEMGDFITGAKAQQFSVEYKSVIIYGRLKEVQQAEKKIEVLKTLLQKAAPQATYAKDYEAPATTAIETTAVWKLKIERWTGKESVKKS